LDESKHILLSGFGGMGKTALAATIAAKRINDGKGSVIWMKIGKEKFGVLFEALVECLGERRISVDRSGNRQLMLYQLLTQSTIGLLILDDARNGPALHDILRGIPNDMPVLVTSRERFGLDAIIEVGNLAPNEALKLLAYYADQLDYSDDVTAIQLCKQLGY